MKTILVTAIVLVIGLIAYSFIIGKQYKFYYFPETNMYYDKKKGQYIYSMDGGKTWAIMSRATKEIPEVLGEKVLLKSKSPNIWELNPKHRAQYNGVLTDVNALSESRSEHSAKAGKGIHSRRKQPHTLDSQVGTAIDNPREDSSAISSSTTSAEEETIDINASIGISEEKVLSSKRRTSTEITIPVKKNLLKRSDSTQKTEDSTELKTPLLMP